MHEIKDVGSYLLVQVSGELDFSTILKIVDEELARPEYPDRNDIWDLRQASLALQFEQLGRLWKHIMDHYPMDARHDKVAIVAQPGLNSSYAEMWATSRPATCPFAVRVFKDFGSAESWVTSWG